MDSTLGWLMFYVLNTGVITRYVTVHHHHHPVLFSSNSTHHPLMHICWFTSTQCMRSDRGRNGAVRRLHRAPPFCFAMATLLTLTYRSSHCRTPSASSPRRSSRRSVRLPCLILKRSSPGSLTKSIRQLLPRLVSVAQLCSSKHRTVQQLNVSRLSGRTRAAPSACRTTAAPSRSGTSCARSA